MKKISKKPFWALIIATSLFACKKESQQQDVNEEVVANVVSEAVSSHNGGFTEQIDIGASLAVKVSNNGLNCGSTKDTTISKSLNTPLRSFSYHLNWQWQLECNAGSPQKFTAKSSGNSTYSGLLMAATDNTNSTLEVTGLDNASTEFTVKKTQTRTGSQTAKASQLSFTSETTFSSSNIKVDKATKKIKSGTATVTVTGGSSSKKFNYSGTITFLGNNNATLTLNTGKSFTFNW